MSKSKPPIYEFPKEVTREYHLLMSSKESFLKQPNLTHAERRKLATSYEQLESAWVRNSIESLTKQLLEKYAALRRIQNELAESATMLKPAIHERFKQSLERKQSFLTLRKQALKAKNVTFNATLLIWKTDILAKEEAYSLHKLTTNQSTNQRLTELRETLQNWEQVEARLASEKQKLALRQTELNDILALRRKGLSEQQQQNATKRTELHKQEQVYQQSTSQLMRELDNSLELVKRSCEASMKQTQQDWEKTLNEIEENYLQLLSSEILALHPELAEESRTYMMRGEFSLLWRKKLLLSADCEKLKQYLMRGLSKIGNKYSPDDFLERTGSM